MKHLALQKKKTRRKTQQWRVGTTAASTATLRSWRWGACFRSGQRWATNSKARSSPSIAPPTFSYSRSLPNLALVEILGCSKPITSKTSPFLAMPKTLLIPTPASLTSPLSNKGKMLLLGIHSLLSIPRFFSFLYSIFFCLFKQLLYLMKFMCGFE